MNAPDSDGIIQKDLDCHEQTVVADLEEWLKANPQAQWNEVAGLKLVEQCPETNLRQIQKRLAQNFRVATFRTRHSGWELGLGIGELIPISPSEGCNVKVGEHTYPLIGGKKVCILKKAHVELAGGDVLYLVWKQKLVDERNS
ncbi:hypothetical protein N7471_013367 [Penicillium samsonianum]|uniref:uncharacterized protein n=1 Tax=Penicillium samsonianum TaxID=1882272 RepID=UPI002547EFB3|nr:uncharacterized protein N7471_013367 [Penicillium samsonianum]KAJ6118747.1 hypothetical protein N7471_013367 [Penicillium samsonianum]